MSDLATEVVLEQTLASLMQHWRRSRSSATSWDQAQQTLLDGELRAGDSYTVGRVRDHLHSCLTTAELVLNGLSASLELPRLLLLGDQEQIRRGAMERAVSSIAGQAREH